jgi:hypothetical protein
MSSTDALGLPSSNSKTLVPKLPFLRRLKYTLIAFALQNFLVKPFACFKGLKDYLLPPQIRADVVKTYASRPRLPIRYDSYSAGGSQLSSFVFQCLLPIVLQTQFRYMGADS